MTSPDATNYGSGVNSGPSSGALLDRELTRNHNPIWAVRAVPARGGVDQQLLRVYACDDTQARRYVADALGLVAIAVWLADD